MINMMYYLFIKNFFNYIKGESRGYYTLFKLWIKF